MKRIKFETSSGISVLGNYNERGESVDSPRFGFQIEDPGEYPYTRGIQSDMYRGRPWTMRQYAGFGSASESNKRYKYLLSKGQTGLSVAFDLPTQLGLDPDHSLAKGEVGRVGVSIASLDDIRDLFHGIDLSLVSTSMTINATAGVLLALYLAVARSNGTPFSKLRGTVQNDLLKEFSARGNYIFPAKASLKLSTDIIEYCSKELPQWNPISISGYHIREAGSNAVQELAFTMAHGIEYIQSSLSRGLKIDQFAGRFSFFFNVHNDFFEEIAKFRAARRIWAKLLKERFAAKEHRSMALKFHAQTGGSTLTAQQPENNITRVGFQALAAVLGGCQSLHTNGFDEALALPTEKSATIALRTQQILAFETGVTKTPDPLGGSFFVESLTDEIEKRVHLYLEKIDSLGGALQALESGFFQSEISQSAYDQQLAIEKNETMTVGVNCFQEQQEESISLQKISEQLEMERCLQIKKFKEGRVRDGVAEQLKNLKSVAQNDQNTMPAILQAVEAQCTLGEISDVFRDVFGLAPERGII